jgi:hypothetical protein
MQIVVSLVSSIACLPAHAPTWSALTRRCGSRGIRRRPLARTASRESNYPADPPIDAAAEAAGSGRNEEETIFGIEKYGKGVS